MTKTRRVQHFKAMFVGPCGGLGLTHSAPPPQIKTSDSSLAVPKVLRPLSAIPGVLCRSESSVKVACRNVKHSSRRLDRRRETLHLQCISGREEREGVGSLHCCGLLAHPSSLAAPEVPHSEITAQIDEERGFPV